MEGYACRWRDGVRRVPLRLKNLHVVIVMMWRTVHDFCFYALDLDAYFEDFDLLVLWF